MTGNKCLLDTCIIIHVFKNNSDITVQLYTFSEIFIPSIAAGELYYRAYCSASVKKHLDQTNQFLQNYTILAPDVKTGELYGSIKTILKSKGKPVPENDIWIAAMAIRYDLPLFTSDKHFKEIENLILV